MCTTTVTLPDTTTVTFTYYADGNRATKTTATEYIEYHYNGSLLKEVHMDATNVVLFTVHYQGCKYTIDPGAEGGGDEVEYYPITDVSTYAYSPFGEKFSTGGLHASWVWSYILLSSPLPLTLKIKFIF